MPQNILKNWKEISDEDHEKNIHRLGNLTLTCYNPKLSDKAFSEKINLKDKNGNNIGLHSKNVKINSYLEHRFIWTIDDIDTRSNILADEILRLLGN
jgi:hypothetical protein